MLRVLIVHPDALIRAGLKHILNEEYRDAVFGEAKTPDETFVQIGKQPWDLTVLNINRPGTHNDALYILQETLLRRPGAHILMLSSDGDCDCAATAMQLGAMGCVSTNASRPQLVTALKNVLSGKTFFGRSTQEEPPAISPIANEHASLSVREQKVLLAIAAGKHTSEIAAEWNVSVKTVSTYRWRALQKLGLKSTADLVRYVIDKRLAPDTDGDLRSSLTTARSRASKRSAG